MQIDTLQNQFDNAASVEFFHRIQKSDTLGVVHDAHVFLGEKLTNIGVTEGNLSWMKALTFFLVALVLCWFMWWLSRKLLSGIIHTFAERTKSTWDDMLLKHSVFSRFASLVPVFFLGHATLYIFRDYPSWIPHVYLWLNILNVVVIMRGVASLIDAIFDILQVRPGLVDKPMKSYAQLGKLILYLICGVLLVSIVFDKSPIYFFSAMGAMTAVLLLIFKDTLLGFVASIQIAAHDMVRIGDWVTMEKYGADGDVEEITLNTVKVRNFDNTITTIPTYAFISDSFKNWRGMQESDGRRIKRAINISIASVKFCTPEMIEQFGEFTILQDFMEVRRKEIETWNEANNVGQKELLNGRQMTNLGVFRAYLTHYLKNNEHINQEMTLMVRQLNPTETGIPLEIYAFTSDKSWVNYEGIISDIFDHVLAAIPRFELQVFQNPSGADFKAALTR